MNHSKFRLTLLAMVIFYSPTALISAADTLHVETSSIAHTEENHQDHSDDKTDEHDEVDHHGEEKGHREQDDHGEEGGHGEEKEHGAHDEHGKEDDHNEEKGHEEHGEQDDHDEEDDHNEEKGHDTHGEKDADGGHEEESSGVELNPQQLNSAGIQITTLMPKAIPVEIEALGEIRLNAYATSQITPRIEAQIVKRLVRLGDHVVKGQALVVLSSVAMAEAQAELLVSANEWQRVKKLGPKVVSQSRYLESRIAFQQAQAKVLTYGMTHKQTKKLLSDNTISQVNGEFNLLSPQDGTVIRDEFIRGQLAQPGDRLFTVTDESVLWAEIRVNPESVTEFSKGASVRINLGKQWLSGKVLQIYHELDEVSRTLAVRVSVPNPKDNLHPGQFITARITTHLSNEKVLFLPTHAVLRSPDGDWQVYIETTDGTFEAKEITVVREIPGMMVIEGIDSGTRVVTEGAFFVQSEQAKSGFEVHNH